MPDTIVAPRLGDRVDLVVRWGTQERLRCCNRYFTANGALAYCPSCRSTYQRVNGSDEFLVVNVA